MARPSELAILASGGTWHPAEHLLYLEAAFLAVAAGETRRIQINLPPRHGKSLYARYFAAWYLLNHPDREVIICAATDSLARPHGEFVRDVVAEHGPWLAGLTVRQTHAAADDWQLAHARSGAPTGGGLRSAGVGTALLGRGATLLVIDDLYGGVSDITSEANRALVHRWCVQTAFSRLAPGGAVVSIGTPHHVDDIFGRFELAEREGGEKWTRVRLPALAEEGDPLGRAPGEALWPERYPASALEAIRADKEANGLVKDWLANYQLRPAAGDGVALWPAGYFHGGIFFDQLPAGPWAAPIPGGILSVDTAHGRRHGDYQAFVYARYQPDGDVYVWSEAHRLDPDQLYDKGLELIERWQPSACVVETNEAGHVLYHRLRAQLPGVLVLGRRHQSTENKLARIEVRLTPYLARGLLHLARSCPGCRLLVRQAQQFPYGDHDDMLDSLEMNLELARELSLPVPLRAVKYER